MTEQSANSQDTARYHWQSPPVAADAVSIGSTDIRSIRRNVCPECGEQVHSQMDSCPACGESLARKPRIIRCMHCSTTASSELTLCPGCGRELREAPPKLLTYGAPALVALLLVFVLVSQWERVSPIAWVRSNLMRGVVIVENVGASIEPEVVIVMTPIVPEDAENGIVISDTQAVALAAESLVTPLPDPNAVSESQESILSAAVSQELPMGIGGPQPGSEGEAAMAMMVEEVEPTEPPATEPPTEIPPTDTPVATPTVEPTAVPPTATPAPVLETTAAPTAVKSGGVAAALVSSGPAGTPTPTWTAALATVESDSTGGDAEAVQVAGITANSTAYPTVTPTPTVGVTPLPTPTPTPVVYQVDRGDTLVSIAARYDVTVDELMEANNISEQDVYVLQPGQMLIIPLPTPEAVVASDNSDAIRLGVPKLLVPSNGATVGCATGGKLIWERVQFIKDSDRYVLHLGFVSGRGDDGQENVTWVLAQSNPVTRTEWQLDTALCDLAAEDFGRQWRWWVEVVEESEGESVSVSPPSEVWGFTWE
jgi:LysM repeat protein